MYDHFLAKHSLKHEIIHRVIYGFFFLKIFNRGRFRITKQKRIMDAGNWYLNDTAWRMVVDLVKIIHFSDNKGKIHNTFQRNLFSIVDGIIGGERDGPLSPDPKPSGTIIAGENLLAVDLVATRLMGFNPYKLKQYTKLDPSFDFGPKNFNDIDIYSNKEVFQEDFNTSKNTFLSFKPHPGWVGHIEIDAKKSVKKVNLN